MIINPDQIPHPLAASTDISKVVRMEYGTDTFYMEMANKCIDGWKAWNELFNDTLYHEIGYLLVCKQPLDADEESYEGASYRNLLKRSFKPERLDAETIQKRFPAFKDADYVDGFYHARAGFTEASRSVTALVNYARQLGVEVYERQTADELVRENGKISCVKTREGERFEAGNFVVCAGPYTPYLVPELKPYFQASGHPVFHVKPSQPELFTPPNFAVFAGDISRSGWYGFPLHPREGVVKIANHGVGLRLHPEKDERVVTEEDTQKFRAFLRETIPALANDPIVFTRRCVYADTLDGHFWIDSHPDIKNLTIGAGGSGHGLKMGPEIGKLIATAAEGGDDKWLARFRWRRLTDETQQEEEARFLNR